MHLAWIDWNRPLLPAAAEWLIDRAAGSADDELPHLHLEDHLIVLPGRRSGRVLLETLLRRTREAGRPLVPPRIVTPGAMIEVLFPPEQPLAGEVESYLAWAAALQELGSDVLADLLPEPPDSSDLLAWHNLAGSVQRLHEELAGENLDSHAVARHIAGSGLDMEVERWRALARAEDHYHELLSRHGLADRHRARAAALRQSRGPAEGIDGIVLIGIVELNAMQREALQQFSDRVTALVHAPEALADRFDAFGCVRPEAWTNEPVDTAGAGIVVADRPEDQAQAVMDMIARLNEPAAGDPDASDARASASPRFSADEITIGLGDPSLTRPLELAAEWAGLRLHPAEGIGIRQTGPWRLMEAVSSWLEEPRFAHFAALVRHPDLESWLHARLRADRDRANNATESASEEDAASGVEHWITLLDRYFTKHLHERLSDTWLGSRDQQRALQRIYRAVTNVLEPIAETSPKPVGQWAEPTLQVLSAIYGEPLNESVGRAAETRDALLSIRDTLARLALIERGLQPPANAADAIRIMLNIAAAETIPAPLHEDEIEMLGWLELHPDPAPVLVLVGVNDGSIPATITADHFLPNSLRRQLGLADNAARYARDAYRLSAVAQSRASVTLITGRRSHQGEPLTPSRLLLATEAEELTNRIRQVSEPHRALRWDVPIGAPAPAQANGFTVPATPDQPPVIESMSVTAFSDYLKCPYRFWLKHILQLHEIEDTAEELDPLRFGSLAHAVLQRFGQDEQIRASASADAIERYLHDALDALAKETFGSSPRPAVRVQIARLRRRLEGFARFQAQQRTDGWRIEAAEFKVPDEAALSMPDGNPMPLRAKIDRIDRHETTGAYRVIDYKTGENAKSPFELHHGRKTYREGEWCDLQLPLYHYLARSLGYAGTIELGYIVLPRDADAVAFLAARWNDQQLEEAIETAREVVRDIRAGRFEPNPEYAQPWDQFARILQTNVLGENDQSDGGGP